MWASSHADMPNLYTVYATAEFVHRTMVLPSNGSLQMGHASPPSGVGVMKRWSVCLVARSKLT
jgi:hypothetical protein